MKRLFPILLFALVAAACTPQADDNAPTPTDSAEGTTTTTAYTGPSYAGTIAAPEFPDGLDWINTASPVSLESLKGKIVLLDFWTYGCVNCIHIIPDLERLEAEYANELVVIGVHSAKFPNEGETTNLRDIVQRYGVEHPVVNDKDFEVWQVWGATAWPTIALIDPAGNVVGVRAGEGVYDAVQPVVEGLVGEFSARNEINAEPAVFSLEADSAPDRPLAYPGKVLAQDGLLFVSDTGHHRVLQVDPTTGEVLAAYGSGERGNADGRSLEASFNSPQGLALDGSTLFVADTNNHLIRAVDIATGEVSTVVGTGEKGWPPTSGPILETSLASPWDVEVRDGLLYIANAGTHQIWLANLEFGTAGPFIGSAREGTANGGFAAAELAQPSSVTISDDGKLFFADSESSAIRVGNLATAQTALVVGGDADLFTFGDVDGAGNQARLQHPLGTEVVGLTLYVADTYNSKIKRVDLTTDAVTSWLGGEAGWQDGAEPQFNEPGGISHDAGVLYVADTNNHSIRTIDLDSGETGTLVLKGVEAFDPPAAFSGEVVDLGTLAASSGEGTLVLDYTLPDGFKVNEDAPSSVTVSGGEPIASFGGATSYDITGTALPAQIPVTFQEGTDSVSFDVTLIYCRETASDLCFIDRTRFTAELEAADDDLSTQLTLPRRITQG